VVPIFGRGRRFAFNLPNNSQPTPRSGSGATSPQLPHHSPFTKSTRKIALSPSAEAALFDRGRRTTPKRCPSCGSESSSTSSRSGPSTSPSTRVLRLESPKASPPSAHIEQIRVTEGDSPPLSDKEYFQCPIHSPIPSESQMSLPSTASASASNPTTPFVPGPSTPSSISHTLPERPIARVRSDTTSVTPPPSRTASPRRYRTSTRPRRRAFLPSEDDFLDPSAFSLFQQLDKYPNFTHVLGHAFLMAAFAILLSVFLS
jgi:hypothetical protein